jgi:type VI secretion system protein ImpC
MAQVAESGFAEVHLTAEEAPEGVALAPDRPFRILLVGDFSGRAWQKTPSPSLTPQPIDRDNFDDVLNRTNLSLEVHGITLQFRELEDFHPDRICASVAVFQDLDRLAAEPAADAAPAPAPPRAAPAGGLLDAMLADEAEQNRPVTAEDANDLAAFIRRATAGHLVPRDTPAKLAREARRNALAGELLRGILRHPRMQAIEAAWRAVFMLVRGVETGEDLKVYLLDLTLPELISEMDSLKKTLGAKGPWGVIAGNYTLGQSALDAKVLERLSGFARALGAPFLAEARVPEGEPDPSWTQLRRSADARWLGLALPRFLLRLPYGKDTSAIESFPFEEMPESEHAAYLWGNPAFFCAQLIGQSFAAHGWDLARRLARRIDNLPMHVYHEDGELLAKPCAEIFMTERDAETLLEAGFMPIASLKHEPAALVVRYQSIAEPAASLAGLS